MTAPRRRAVLDCSVYLPAPSNATGASGRCLDAAFRGALELVIDRLLLAELSDVLSRPTVARKLRVLPSRLDRLMSFLERDATLIENVPEVFTYPRDPSDAHYVNLAIHAGAMLVVSHDLDLLDLMNERARKDACFGGRTRHFRC